MSDLGPPPSSHDGTGDVAPLAGLRVIDVGTRISAPFCAGLLGEMGAEVIKVEQPDGGDFMRTIGPFAVGPDGEDYSMWWAVEGRGRKGVTLDLRQSDGQDLFRRLVATADVVCENFRPGTVEAWNVGPDDCDPRLVWARISVFGQDGPYAGRPGLDRMGIAYGGLLAITGYPDRPPVRPGVTISDYLTGTFAAEAVLAALYRRDRPGTGTGRGGAGPGPHQPGNGPHLHQFEPRGGHGPVVVGGNGGRRHVGRSGRPGLHRDRNGTPVGLRTGHRPRHDRIGSRSRMAPSGPEVAAHLDVTPRPVTGWTAECHASDRPRPSPRRPLSPGVGRRPS